MPNLKKSMYMHAHVCVAPSSSLNNEIVVVIETRTKDMKSMN